MATVAYLRLDEQNDPVFADGTVLIDVNAVTQIVLTRLKLFYGEWWENLKLGLPVFQQMLGQLGSKNGLALMQTTIEQNIREAPYVTGVQAVKVLFIDGALLFAASFTTVFGPASISSLPGADAAL